VQRDSASQLRFPAEHVGNVGINDSLLVLQRDAVHLIVFSLVLCKVLNVLRVRQVF
jgi:hypothetical protein